MENKLKRIFAMVKDPGELVSHILCRSIFHYIPDKIYLCIQYRIQLNKRLDLKKPQTFNEKLQWLKLYDRKPIYTTMVDKYAVKEYVAKIIGEEYTIPTLGVWNHFDEIDFDSLPERFVLKCTHNSGGIVMCKDKSKFDRKAARKKFNHYLRRIYYYSGREWPYKNVLPRIIAEKYMVDESGVELKDSLTEDILAPIDNWKFFYSYGKLLNYYVAVGGGHSKDIQITYFDVEGNILPVRRSDCPNIKNINERVKIPDKLEEMKELGSRMSREIPFVRIDFYYVNAAIYFGEFTFYPDAGFMKFVPEEYDEIFGQMINLPINRRSERNE